MDSNIKLYDLTTIDRFKYYLRYNVETFIQLYSFFIQNNLQNIVDYFENSTSNPDTESFNFLARLIEESKKIQTLIKLNKSSFKRIDDWELLDFLTDIHTKLQSIDNTSKWTRSSKTKNSWQGNVIQANVTLSDHQTIEQVSEDVYGSVHSQDDWMRISIENDISERDYSVDSNNTIQVTKQMLTSPNYYLQSVIDNLVGKKMYGLDINNKIQFVDGDILVLTGNDTVVQAIKTTVSIKKGDVPEFNSLGVDRSLAVGSSFSALRFSSIIRQLNELFSTDDSLRNFRVTEISYINGKLSLTYKVDTMYNFVYSNTLEI